MADSVDEQLMREALGALKQATTWFDVAGYAHWCANEGEGMECQTTCVDARDTITNLEERLLKE